MIAKYHLQPVPEHPGIHSTTSGDRSLMIGGVGRINAARAVERMGRAQSGATPAVWLNIGIAGHGSEPPGTPLLVSEILERASGRRCYPSGILPPTPGRTALCTVDEPQCSYEPGWAYDMEGSGFMEAVLGIGGSPAQCLKIVSDGPTRSWKDLSASMVEELIGSSIEVVDSLLRALTAAASSYPVEGMK